MMYRVKLSLLLFVSILLIGCIKIPIGDGNSIKFSKDGFTVTDKDGAESGVSFDEEEGSLHISTGEDGDGINVIAGENSELPEDFPEEIPIADDATIVQAADMSEGTDRYYMIMYYSENPLDKLIDTYRQYIDSAGFEDISPEMDTEELFEGGEIMHSMRGEEEYFMVSVLEDEDSEDDVVTVSITYGNVE